jgi:glycerol-3-phosphate acyltransferase PlsY
MTTGQQLILLAIGAYLLGSVPFGLLIGWSRGIDVRKAGSGNIGATNVGRLLGRPFFALVFTLDLLKGAIPMLIGAAILHGHPATPGHYWLWLLVAFGAIMGHLFSIFLKFKGGKGVATSAGVLVGVFPYYTLPGIICTILFYIIFRITRYISLASIIVAGLLPVFYMLLGVILGWDVFGTRFPLLIFAFLIAALVIFKHRTNIARLRAGTEHRAPSRATQR